MRPAENGHHREQNESGAITKFFRSKIGILLMTIGAVFGADYAYSKVQNTASCLDVAMHAFDIEKLPNIKKQLQKNIKNTLGLINGIQQNLDNPHIDQYIKNLSDLIGNTNNDLKKAIEILKNLRKSNIKFSPRAFHALTSEMNTLLSNLKDFQETAKTDLGDKTSELKGNIVAIKIIMQDLADHNLFEHSNNSVLNQLLEKELEDEEKNRNSSQNIIHQEWLIDMGYLKVGDNDGIMGPKTKEAIAAAKADGLTLVFSKTDN